MDKGTVSLRKVRNARDITVCKALLSELWPEAPPDFKALPSFVYSRRHRCEIIMSDRRDCGIIFSHFEQVLWSSRPFLVIDVFVLTSVMRGRGIGKAVMTKYDMYAHRKECDGIMLLSGNHRKRAHTWYERNGFIQEDKGFYKYFFK